MSRTATRAADLLRSARQGTAIADLPEDLKPSTAAEAYAIQDATVARAGVGGWKVAPVPDYYGAPIDRDRFHPDGTVYPVGALRDPEVEIEIALVLGADLPPIGRPYRVEEVRAAVASVHAAVEMVGSAFADRRSVAMLTALADQQSNATVLLGTGTPAGLALDFASVPVRVVVNGATIHDGPSGRSTAATLDALAWLATHAADRRGGLKAGDVVITGARVGPFPAKPGDRVEARFEGIGAVAVAFAG
ncbi:2-keto-4-pentenoate hydratase [Prosthecomicrobium sp. N25]|uniref:2-keto-4-pentenoate hydratase n=1 Tax=Prosthecomicrobium sp. N25 TaxID=3129254 RepID=UPI003078788E